jgi:hypothetical protein
MPTTPLLTALDELMQQAAVCFESHKYGDAAELMEYAAMICRILNREFLKICREISDGYREVGQGADLPCRWITITPWRNVARGLPLPTASPAQHIIRPSVAPPAAGPASRT